MAQNLLQQLNQTSLLLGDLSQAIAAPKLKLFVNMITSRMYLLTGSIENYKDLDSLC